MAPKHHPAPLSGGDRKALTKELSKSRAMTKIFAELSEEKRRQGEALIREADNLACQSWNEKMWSDGGPIDPSPTIDQAINGGYCIASPNHLGCGSDGSQWWQRRRSSTEATSKMLLP